MSLSILNVGAGDTKLSFDPSKPAEVERACHVVQDMLAKGYAILVEVGLRDGQPLYQRAKAFDAATAEYIVVGAPEVPQPRAQGEVGAKHRKPKSTRVKAHKTRAVAVARSAGG